MSIENSPSIEPVFDPNDLGQSLDLLDGLIPVRSRLLRGFREGETMSPRRGHGQEIDGVRDYEIGDDVRYIDWRLSARVDDEDDIVVREHYADVTPSLWVVTDAIGRRYDTKPGYFSEKTLALSAIVTMMRLANRQGMPSGLIASNDTELVIQRNPANGGQHIWSTAELLHDLSKLPVATSEQGKSKRGLFRRSRDQDVIASQAEQQWLSSTLVQAAGKCVENVVMIVSDFRDTSEPAAEPHGWSEPLQHIAQRGNDIIAVELTNPLDFRVPVAADNMTLYGRVADLDRKDGDAIRREYAELAVKQQAAIDAELAEVNAVHIKLSTENPLWFSSLQDQLLGQRR